MSSYGSGSYGTAHYGIDSEPIKRILTVDWDVNAKSEETVPHTPIITNIEKRPQKVVIEYIEKRGER